MGSIMERSILGVFDRFTGLCQAGEGAFAGGTPGISGKKTSKLESLLKLNSFTFVTSMSDYESFHDIQGFNGIGDSCIYLAVHDNKSYFSNVRTDGSFTGPDVAASFGRPGCTEGITEILDSLIDMAGSKGFDRPVYLVFGNIDDSVSQEWVEDTLHRCALLESRGGGLVHVLWSGFSSVAFACCGLFDGCGYYDGLGNMGVYCLMTKGRSKPMYVPVDGHMLAYLKSRLLRGLAGC